jgi:hypothetical protein
MAVQQWGCNTGGAGLQINLMERAQVGKQTVRLVALFWSSSRTDRCSLRVPGVFSRFDVVLPCCLLLRLA